MERRENDKDVRRCEGRAESVSAWCRNDGDVNEYEKAT